MENIRTSPKMGVCGVYRLFVKDGILTESLKIALSSDPNEWADYVFEPNYPLMPLAQVKHYVQTQKHLPNMPSTCDLQANGGLDVKQLMAKQQEKIEELYLYLIQQQAQIEALQQQQLSTTPPCKN